MTTMTYEQAYAWAESSFAAGLIGGLSVSLCIIIAMRIFHR